MRSVLLLGAGFSRNWGGWLASEVFEYLVSCKPVWEDIGLRRILLDHKTSFEDALARVQASYRCSRDAENSRRLELLQSALVKMFTAMDAGFCRREFEFQNEISYLLRTFMIRFDAIFSLNQDSLLERHYLNDNVALGSAGRWTGWQLPGLEHVPDGTGAPFDGQLMQWRPQSAEGFKVRKHDQPCFKLHGSMNWSADDGSPILVMGGNKEGSLAGHPVLQWYFEKFKEYLSGPTRVMTIGYSYRDRHINDVLMAAARRRQLKLFVIDPLGVQAIGQGNGSRGGAVYQRSDVEELLEEEALVGVSSRGLRETFGDDRGEHIKLMQFFES